MINYRFSLFFLSLIFSTMLFAQSFIFKDMKGRTLSGQNVTLPDYFSKRLTFIAFGFDREHQAKIDQIMKPFVARYQNHDTIFYMEIPMIGASFSWFSSFIENGMRKGIPKSFHSHTMSYYKDLKPYLSHYKLINKKEPFFILIDSNNQIIWRWRGRVSSTLKNELFSRCDQFLEENHVK